ncbi:MAG: 3D domain-containing protein [Acidobacteria bacterium]|nr:3D domain-containing protein [Acidobacteriota bacterium]
MTAKLHRFGILLVLGYLAAQSAGCAAPLTHARQPVRAPEEFVATAYCQTGLTATGARVRHGIVAADPAVLSLGSVIRVRGLEPRYNRDYHVLDTGKRVRGRQIDVYVADCDEAIRFGRRTALVLARPGR